MSLESSELHSRVLSVTRAGAMFENLVEGMLQQLRVHFGVPPELNPEDPASEMIEWEIDQVRQKLSAFSGCFGQLYTTTLARHVGAEQLPGVLAALEDARVQSFLGAAANMEAELSKGVEQLAQRMTASLQPQ